MADLPLKINHFFGVENLSIGTDYVKYSVNSIKDITKVIIPHFMQYPLVTKKEPLLTGRRRRTLKRGCFAPDFELFKLVVELMDQKEHREPLGGAHDVHLPLGAEHLTIEGINKIASLKASMNRGLSEKFKPGFPNIIPVERPIVEKTETIDPD